MGAAIENGLTVHKVFDIHAIGAYICMNIVKDTYTISQAQANLPKLCRSKKRFLIARRDKPVYVAMPIEDFDAVLETMELLANPKAMRALRAARAGKVKYTALDLQDANFGL